MKTIFHAGTLCKLWVYISKTCKNILLVTSKLWLNVHETSIKRCSGQSRLLSHKLNIETVHKMCENDRDTIVPYSQYYVSPMQTMLFWKFKIVCTVKTDNKPHDQLIYIQHLISLKIIFCNLSVNPWATWQTIQIH